jgi:6,7-dimethyl-8-ribityllumazine synthase
MAAPGNPRWTNAARHGSYRHPEAGSAGCPAGSSRAPFGALPRDRPENHESDESDMTTPRILIIDARFYDDIADALLAGATEVLEGQGADVTRVSVPGVLEIPAALAMALAAMESGQADFDGFVLLGCVIRGETSHYDIVANESARAVMELVIDAALPLGNGILTVENREQAWARADVQQKNKGGAAAQAALDMIAVRDRLGV